MSITRAPDTLRMPSRRHPVPTRTRVRTRRMPIIAYVAVLLILPVAVVLGARATGWWVTTGHTVPATAVGGGVIGTDPTAGSGQPGSDGAGTAITDPDTVKGSMTVRQVLDAFSTVTAAGIYRQFGVPADTPTSTQLKELAANGNGYEVSDLREWLETRQGPADPPATPPGGSGQAAVTGG